MQTARYANSLHYKQTDYTLCKQLTLYANSLHYMQTDYIICKQLTQYANSLYYYANYLHATYTICKQQRPRSAISLIRDLPACTLFCSVHGFRKLAINAPVRHHKCLCMEALFMLHINILSNKNIHNNRSHSIRKHTFGHTCAQQ